MLIMYAARKRPFTHRVYGHLATRHLVKTSFGKTFNTKRYIQNESEWYQTNNSLALNEQLLTDHDNFQKSRLVVYQVSNDKHHTKHVLDSDHD